MSVGSLIQLFLENMELKGGLGKKEIPLLVLPLQKGR